MSRKFIKGLSVIGKNIDPVSLFPEVLQKSRRVGIFIDSHSGSPVNPPDQLLKAGGILHDLVQKLVVGNAPPVHFLPHGASEKYPLHNGILLRRELPAVQIASPVKGCKNISNIKYQCMYHSVLL